MIGGRKSSLRVNRPDAFSYQAFDPVSREFIRAIREVAGMWEFGLRFPYEDGSTLVTTISANTDLTARINRYHTLEITGTAVLTCTLSPTFIFARNITIATGAAISGDGRGAPGGDRKSTRLNSSHIQKSRMPSSA